MKKRTTILIVCAVMIMLSVTALCNENTLEKYSAFFDGATDVIYATDSIDLSEPFVEPTFEAVLQPQPVLKPVIFSGNADVFVRKLDSLIADNNINSNDQKRIKNKFITTVSEYRMTADELEQINLFINADYDIEKVLDIYEFLRWTDSDLSLIEQIYNEGAPDSDKEFWIYDTYDKLLNRTDDILSVEDVAYYVGLGLTVDEITGAYELSFAGKKTTKQMLDERANGASWNSIAAEVISNTPEVIESAPEMNIDEVMTVRRHSVRMRNDAADIIVVENGTVTLSPAALANEQKVIKTKNELITKYDAQLPKRDTLVDFGTNLVTYSTPDVSAETFDQDYPEDYIIEQETECE